VPLAEYTENLKTIIAKLRNAGVSNILLMTPPPVDDTNGKFPDGARSLARAGQYADAALGVAKALGLPSVDIWRGVQARLGRGWGEGRGCRGGRGTGLWAAAAVAAAAAG
jgi:hypothetical protein